MRAGRRAARRLVPPGLPAAGDRTIIAKTLAAYDEGPAGEAILKTLGVTGFTEGGEIRLRALNAWLKGKP